MEVVEASRRLRATRPHATLPIVIDSWAAALGATFMSIRDRLSRASEFCHAAVEIIDNEFPASMRRDQLCGTTIIGRLRRPTAAADEAHKDA